ncbi:MULTISPECIES: substrate-binding domain-containing protein [unclassified Oceanispirochaeta]|uniref:substrate-binding domain-containing protein n=1 Tax=unclassified Oceanispirochaeta TaxID=2635722 RepID=UPI000E097D06|nr:MULTISPECIES: substrate-binding domain-containing protein [unclassified Oceanispirochaeta]MBF9016967.1 substrate-binding domain-containing protein [Oceanispirochaeta sp. M2]NPD73330.1 sugar ABC transporter substrate-binding protein [Oceanispirochaeta sp. M1]RDG30991.1 sugar ABC transporter substrate-binding protein [Oceanispirochaeta sp. M1]
MNKKIIIGVAVLVVLIVSIVFVVTGRQGQESKTLKIGAAMSSFSDKGQTYLQDGVRAFDAEYDDVEIIMTDAKDDPAVQLNQVETLLVKGVDAILIVPVDISALKPVFKKCKEDGVKLVIANRMPAEEFHNEFDVYTGSESIQAGILQAEWVAEAMQPEGGTVGILMGPLGHEAARMRTEGNKQVFAKYDNIEIVMDAVASWDRAKGMQVAENWIQSGANLDAILCNNDEMAIGTLLAAEGANLADADIIIAGVDATPDALEYLGKGLDVTVFQNMNAQGYNGAAAAYKLAKGESVEKWDWIPFETVDPANMSEYK